MCFKLLQNHYHLLVDGFNLIVKTNISKIFIHFLVNFTLNKFMIILLNYN